MTILRDLFKKICRNISYNKSFGNYLKDKRGISQNVKGIIRGYKEIVEICKKYDQPLYGKMMMFIKYFKGYIKSFIK